jgi:pimeloyl-ACP methyl ester carboxylesterase
MTAPVVPGPRKSTTVRSVPASLRLLRLGLRASSAIAPATTDRITSELFFKARRSAKAAEPHLDGLPVRRFTVDGSSARLAAWSWGEGPTILFAHGWEGHAGQVSAFAPALVRAGFRVVSFDMPAHGRSTGTHTSVVDMAKAIREVTEDLMPFVGLERAPLKAIIAHSLGGAASVLALSEGLRARRVVLLAPVAEPTPFALRAAAFVQLSPERTAGMLRGVAAILGREFEAVDGRRLARSLDIPALIFHDRGDREVPGHENALGDHVSRFTGVHDLFDTGLQRVGVWQRAQNRHDVRDRRGLAASIPQGAQLGFKLRRALIVTLGVSAKAPGFLALRFDAGAQLHDPGVEGRTHPATVGQEHSATQRPAMSSSSVNDRMRCYVSFCG